MPQKFNLSGSKFDERRACLFTVKGELLWRSKAWTCGLRDAASDHGVLGTRWHEFVWPEDLPGLLKWFADGRENGTHFRVMIPGTGKMMRVTYEKIRYADGVWLVAGNAVPLAVQLPTMPTSFLLSVMVGVMGAKISAAAAAAAADAVTVAA